MPSTRPSHPRGRLRRWLILAGGSLIVVLAVLVAGLPSLVGTSFARNLILAQLNDHLAPGRLGVDRFEVAWTGPTRLVGFQLDAPDGSRVVEAPVAELNRSLGQLLFSGSGTTILTLDRAAVAIQRGPDGKLDLAEALQTLIAHPDPARDLTIRIREGSLVVRAAGLDRPFAARTADLDLTIPPSPRPMTWDLQLKHASGGALVIKGDTNRWTARDHNPSLADLRIDVAADRWPIANQVAGLTSTGWLDGTIEVGRHSERWTIESNARLLDLSLVGEPLRGDRFQPGPVAVVCDVGQNTNGWTIRRFSVDSSVGSFRAVGRLDSGFGFAATPGQSQRLEGRIDLGALARQLPRALRLRPGLTVEGGTARLVAEATGPFDHSTFTLEATVADLLARNDERRLGLRDPAFLSAEISRVGDSVTIRKLAARTSFLNLAATGRLDDATLTGSLDLGALRSQLGDWFDLGDFTTSGRAQLNGSYRVEAQQFTAGVDVKVEEFRLEGGPTGSIQRPLATLKLAGSGRPDAAGWPTVWQSGTMSVESGGSSGRIELQRATDSIAVGARLATEITGSDPGHPIEATLAGSWDGLRQILRCDRIAARGAALGVDPADRLELVARGEINAAAGTIRLEPISGTGSTRSWVRLAPAGIKINGLGRDLAAIRIDAGLEGDLSIVENGPETSSASHRWTANINAQGNNQAVQFAAQGALEPLARTPATDNRVGSLNLLGLYSRVDNRVELTEFQCNTGYGGLTATGRLDDPAGTRRFVVQGQIVPNFAAITAWLKDHVEPGAMLAGQPRAFRFQGVASGLDAAGSVEGELGFNLLEADVYGMKLGPTPIIMRARGGQLLADPISTTLNEGHVRLEPEILWRDSKGDPVLRLGKNSTIRDARINDEVSRRVLAFVAPILEGTTRASGRVSVDVDHAEIPLRSGRSRFAQLDGQVVFDDVAFAPGPLANDLLGAIGRRDATLKLDRPVTLTIADGRINQSGLALPIGDLTRIELAGWVDFDRNLALTATLPVTPAMLGNNPLLTDIAAGTQVRLPIGGTLNSPTIDRDAFADGLKDLGKSLLTRGATRGALELLKRIGQPRTTDPDTTPKPPPSTPAERKASRQERRAERKAERAAPPAATPDP